MFGSSSAVVNLFAILYLVSSPHSLGLIIKHISQFVAPIVYMPPQVANLQIFLPKLMLLLTDNQHLQ